jgi:hypothetical protein
MRLGTGFDDDDIDTMSIPGDYYDAEERDAFYSAIAEVGTLRRSSRRSSHGQETLITLRDVRETDFSPWAL